MPRVLACDPAGLQLQVRRVRLPERHDRRRHAALVADPYRFCAPAASVTSVAVVPPRSAVLTVGAQPYCARSAAGRPFSLGWNVTVSVGPDDRTWLAGWRSPRLSYGPAWHVTANEGAEPDELPAGPVDVAAVAGRALAEELGIDLAADVLAPVVVAHRLLEAGPGSLAVAIHVALGRLGWSSRDVQAAHGHALDGWETVPVPVDARLLDGLAGPWTPWGRACWDGVEAVLARLDRPDDHGR